MHKFPEDPELRKQWIEFCGRGQRWVPGASSKLCSLHFSPSDLSSGRVKARAVPQLLSPKSSLKRCGEDLTEANKRLCQVLVFLYYFYVREFFFDWEYLREFEAKIGTARKVV
jgi:hypothetical protein